MLSGRHIKVLSALGAIMLVASTILGCTSSTAPKSSTDTGKAAVRLGGTLRFVADKDPVSLDPPVRSSGGDLKFWATMFDNLVAYNQQGIPDPSISLAESWDVTDPKKIVFKLRKGIKFHDGTDFDASVVKWNIERIQDPATGSSVRTQVMGIQKVEVIDPYTVSFQLAAPNAALLNLLGDNMGAMVSPTAAKKYGAQSGRNPVGTGAFKFVEWVQNDHVTVERNPDYWQKDKDGNQLPYLDKVILKIVPESVVRLANLETGEADISDVAPLEWDRIEKEGKLTTVDFNGAATEYIRINSAMPPLDNVDVRMALSLAIDREGFNKAINQGKFVVATSHTTPAQFTYVKDLQNAPKYDLKKAQELMDKAAVPPSARKIVISVQPDRISWAEFVQAAWAKLGFQTDIKSVSTSEATSMIYVEKSAGMMISTFSLRADPDGTYRDSYYSDAYYNPGHRPNPELDALIDKGGQTYNIEERKKIYRQVEEILAKDTLVISIAYTVLRHAANKKVQNLNTLFGAEGKERFKEIWLSQ